MSQDMPRIPFAHRWFHFHSHLTLAPHTSAHEKEVRRVSMVETIERQTSMDDKGGIAFHIIYSRDSHLVLERNEAGQTEIHGDATVVHVLANSGRVSDAQKRQGLPNISYALSAGNTRYTRTGKSQDFGMAGNYSLKC